MLERVVGRHLLEDRRESTQRGYTSTRLLTRPPLVQVPKWMTRVIRTPGPTRVDETVVHRLLHVVDNTILEVVGAVAEQKNARSSLYNDRLMAGPDGAD